MQAIAAPLSSASVHPLYTMDYRTLSCSDATPELHDQQQSHMDFKKNKQNHPLFLSLGLFRDLEVQCGLAHLQEREPKGTA